MTRNFIKALIFSALILPIANGADAATTPSSRPQCAFLFQPGDARPILGMHWNSERQVFAMKPTFIDPAAKIAQFPRAVRFLKERGIQWNPLQAEIEILEPEIINELSLRAYSKTPFLGQRAKAIVETEAYIEMIAEGRFPIYDSHDILNHGYSFWSMDSNVGLYFRATALLEREMNRRGLTKYLFRNKSGETAYPNLADPLTGGLTFAVLESNGDKTKAEVLIKNVYSQWLFGRPATERSDEIILSAAFYHESLLATLRENYQKHLTPSRITSWLPAWSLSARKGIPSLESLEARLNEIFDDLSSDPRYRDVMTVSVKSSDLDAIARAHVHRILD